MECLLCKKANKIELNFAAKPANDETWNDLATTLSLVQWSSIFHLCARPSRQDWSIAPETRWATRRLYDRGSACSVTSSLQRKHWLVTIYSLWINGLRSKLPGGLSWGKTEGWVSKLHAPVSCQRCSRFRLLLANVLQESSAVRFLQKRVFCFWKHFSMIHLWRYTADNQSLCNLYLASRKCSVFTTMHSQTEQRFKTPHWAHQKLDCLFLLQSFVLHCSFSVTPPCKTPAQETKKETNIPAATWQSGYSRRTIHLAFWRAQLQPRQLLRINLLIMSLVVMIDSPLPETGPVPPMWLIQHGTSLSSHGILKRNPLRVPHVLPSGGSVSLHWSLSRSKERFRIWAGLKGEWPASAPQHIQLVFVPKKNPQNSGKASANKVCFGQQTGVPRIYSAKYRVLILRFFPQFMSLSPRETAAICVHLWCRLSEHTLRFSILIFSSVFVVPDLYCVSP